MAKSFRSRNIYCKNSFEFIQHKSISPWKRNSKLQSILKTFVIILILFLAQQAVRPSLSSGVSAPVDKAIAPLTKYTAKSDTYPTGASSHSQWLAINDRTVETSLPRLNATNLAANPEALAHDPQTDFEAQQLEEVLATKWQFLRG